MTGRSPTSPRSPRPATMVISAHHRELSGGRGRRHRRRRHVTEPGETTPAALASPPGTQTVVRQVRVATRANRSPPIKRHHDRMYGRAYNDVSADADPNSGLDVYDSQSGSKGVSVPGTSNNFCFIGGTSLATPLTAAYEAVAGVTPAPSPAWAYTNASLLNDVVSGIRWCLSDILWSALDLQRRHRLGRTDRQRLDQR